jgi:uncharacterized protein YkwD
MNRIAGLTAQSGAYIALAAALPFAASAVHATVPDRSVAAAKQGCRAAKTPAVELSSKTLRRSLTCLIERQRARRDLRELEPKGSLKRVAQAHAELMVEQGCLDHTCPGEQPLEQRIRQSGYPRGARHWRYGSSTGCAVSAKGMLRSWLRSDFHRENVLERKFRDLGVGVEQAAPESKGCQSDFATFAVVFGRREQ